MYSKCKERSVNLLPEISNLVVVDESPSGIAVRVLPSFRALLGSQIYAKEADKTIRRALKKGVLAGARRDSSQSVIFNADQRAAAFELAEILMQKIDNLASRPIDRKNVERVLEITSAECTRWTKDGRLPKSGNLIINRGAQRVQVSTYSPEAVAELIARPEVITLWRHQDKSSSETS
jgi:hypothetical protein